MYAGEVDCKSTFIETARWPSTFTIGLYVYCTSKNSKRRNLHIILCTYIRISVYPTCIYLPSFAFSFNFSFIGEHCTNSVFRLYYLFRNSVVFPVFKIAFAHAVPYFYYENFTLFHATYLDRHTQRQHSLLMSFSIFGTLLVQSIMLCSRIFQYDFICLCNNLTQKKTFSHQFNEVTRYMKLSAKFDFMPTTLHCNQMRTILL